MTVQIEDDDETDTLFLLNAQLIGVVSTMLDGYLNGSHGVCLWKFILIMSLSLVASFLQH